MLKIKNFNNSLCKNSVATIGTFDGVHIGHQKIIERLVNTAKKDGLKSVVLTFFPHPRMVLQKDANIKLINTIDERSEILKNLGLDSLFIKTFTQEFSRLTAEEFVVNILVNQLHIKKIIIGYDHHFGRNRAANIDDLKKFGELYNFEVEEISAQDINDVSVSSTKIRAALDAGDILTANSFLGYNFMLKGTVVKGKGLGGTLGFPTANIQVDEDYKLIPKQGVYIVSATHKEQKLFGMMNIGTTPTVSNKSKETIEVHFFDFNQDIYGEEVSIEFLTRIRDEQKFDSVEELKNQINQDKIEALEFLKQHHAK
ncbi:riboflavin kinase/FMN adenylyltransferase [Oceanihabitans sediminis]|uniref:Riboflavin biosynthesis protein n=1 Tax=Oceanihabitans sediminis TaxID=1812012 RepID=A0A368P8M2_9FLAO|nr:bifunctional riboflavin kinase/FAD synthetase [Oceanihabitans sediminis]RBP34479.1 riboflavin kinase/FMN adenylyltransferase [Oceanihabitans sediminis]RCU58149.1 bifunctional riboflavin kinase/FAD synthetase [Oceanihabitans sediminis]